MLPVCRYCCKIEQDRKTPEDLSSRWKSQRLPAHQALVEVLHAACEGNLY